MSHQVSYPIYPSIADKAHIKQDDYQNMCQQSIASPESFWQQKANQFVTWQTPFEQVYSKPFDQFGGEWFTGGKLNVCYNCVDRHLAKQANQTALLWEGNDPAKSEKITYQQLYEHVCRFANLLKAQGVKKGDTVCIYMPMIKEAAFAMLACARIGAVHSVVFAGFSPESLKTRILDAGAQVVITADGSMRGEKTVPLKDNVDTALEQCPDVRTVIVIKHTKNKIHWHDDRDVDYYQLIHKQASQCEPVWLDANDPMFILYTSGSTGKPKGILHTVGGYLVYAAMTHQYIFDYQPGEIYWCTADIGWITGHTYLVYGPLCNGATTVMFEGGPNYPSFARFWQIIDKHQVNIFYTAPTAIRALRREGDEWLASTQRDSLRILGTVGEPINPEVWEWYYQAVGKAKCPIVDTWWQTETGGILITPLAGAMPLKPGSCGKPFFGVVPAIVNEAGEVVTDEAKGRLVIQKPWPGMMKTIYGNQQRFEDTYFKDCPGYYLSGDIGHCDSEGYYWVQGRSDDVIKVSGHRIGTEEVESALLEHEAVSEAAVVAQDHDIKGQGIVAYITLKSDYAACDDLKHDLKNTVRQLIGPIATPEEIYWAPQLPKTRSGKIMRRVLRKIANHDTQNLGDLSTLLDDSVIDTLIEQARLSTLAE